ncbi:MAG: hypothetical protein PUD91_05575 [Bacteroidales bacterium]|nr:hypothetical protein [Bacteroidales bacterium]
MQKLSASTGGSFFTSCKGIKYLWNKVLQKDKKALPPENITKDIAVAVAIALDLHYLCIR